MKLIKSILYCLLHIFFFTKLRNQVMLLCYNGDKICDSIIYIIQELEKRNIKYYFAKKKECNFVSNNGVKRLSLKYFGLFYKSKIIITNMSVPSFQPKKPGQIWINTWHGAGGYKGYDHTKYDYNLFDYFISESEFDTKLFQLKDAWNFHNKILKIGMPRNDEFYNKNAAYVNNLKEKIGLDIDDFVVLYAPTMRDMSRTIYLEDFSKVISTCENVFKKKTVLLCRNHHFQSKYGPLIESNSNSSVVNVTNYNNMQELLLISDVLITDYSSSARDFSIQLKPVFMYVPDFQEFTRGRGRPFADFSKLPFFISYNEDELLKQIREYDKITYTQKVINYLQENGKYETNGNSTKMLVDICSDLMNKEK